MHMRFVLVIGLLASVAHADGRRATVPTVRLHEIGVKGDLDKAIIRRYLRRSMQRFQFCYERELLVKPTIAGDLAIKFEIDAGGAVTSTSVMGFDKTVADCVGAAIKSIKFPVPKSGTVTTTTKVTFAKPEVK